MRQLLQNRRLGTGSSISPTRKGQSTVEFALVAFILVAMLYGIIKVSRLIYINAAVDNGAREGAHYASLNPPGTLRYSEGALRSAVLF